MVSIKKNLIYNVIYQILTIAMPLITTPYLSRVMGAEKLGIYSYSYSIAYYFVLIAMLGLNNYGNREIARVRDDKNQRSRKFWSIYFLQLSIAAVSIACYIGYCVIFNSDLVSWLMLIYVFSGALDINWFFWGLEEFKITVTRNIIVKVLTISAILLFVKSSKDLIIYVLIMAVSLTISPLLLWPYLKKRVQWYKPSIQEIVSHLKPNIILFIPVIATSLYKVMDKVMLGAMSTYIEVGFYDYSERVIAVPICIVNALGIVMLPRMSYLVENQDKKTEMNMIDYSIILGVAMAASMGFGLMGVADVFVPFFYGSGYAKCITLFYILLPSSVFMAAANVIRTQYLIPHGMDLQYTASVICGAVVNLIVNVILIPKYGSIGAAIGTLIAEAVVCVYQFISVKCLLPISGYIKNIVYLVFSAMVMFGIVSWLPNFGNDIVTIAINVIVGIIIYVCALMLMPKYRNIIKNIIYK